MATLSDQDVQVHKFLKDAEMMFGTIDNLELDQVNPERGSAALPNTGSVRETAQRLAKRLLQLSEDRGKNS